MLLNIVSVSDYGAVGDGTTDDTAAIQSAMDAVTGSDPVTSSTPPQGGGTLFFPPGSYVVSGPLTVNGANLKLMGVGKRNSQGSGWVDLDLATAETVPSTLYLTTETAGFYLPNSNFCNGFHVSGLTVVGPGLPALTAFPSLTPPGPYPQSAFLFDLTGEGNFNRDFVFEDMTVSGCVVAFSLVGETTDLSEGAAGVIRIVRCSIQYNQWIALTGPGLHWNSFIYHQNESGDNGQNNNPLYTGGIYITGENISICDNVLESTPNAVCVNGAGGYQSVEVRNNYFEANSGSYCICINAAPGPWVVGPNNFNPPDPGVTPATQNVLVSNSARGVCHDPAWLQYGIDVRTPDPGAMIAAAPWLGLNNTVDNVTNPYMRVDTQIAMFTRPPATTVAGPAYGHEGNVRVPSPFDGAPMRVTSDSTDSNESVSFERTLAISALSSPLWLVSCVALQRCSSSLDAVPQLALTLDGATTTCPATDVLVYETYVRPGNWALCMFATPITVAAAGSVAATLEVQPYGSGAPGGLRYNVCPPILYVVADINDARPYFNPFESLV